MNTTILSTRGKQRLRLVKQYIGILLSKIYTTTLKPKSFDEDASRKEFILNIILFGTLCLMFIFEGFLLFQYVESGFSSHETVPYFFSFLCLFFLTLYILSRKGYTSLAAYTLVITYTLATTYAAFSWGPDLHQVLVSYAFIVVMAGILISPACSLVVTAFISFTILSLTYLDSIHIIQFERDWRIHTLELNDITELAITYGMICLIAWLSNREIIYSLNRARQSEHELREKNESLEITIEARTKELRATQAEKVSHLYRFAEFGRLSSGIFHDLMNPLSVVAANIELLENSQLPDIKNISVSITQAIQASRRMEKFIITARKQLSTTSVTEQFSPDTEIRNTLVLLKHKAVKAQVSLTYTMRHDNKTNGNISKFSQIVTNLISNAIDACDHPEVPLNRKVVYISLEKKKTFLQITVRDKGCGIAKTIIDKIFDPFFTTKSEHKGLGLGLSTTKAAVEKDFAGTLQITSTEGVGSTFIFTFPIVKKSHEYTVTPTGNPIRSRNTSEH